MIAGGSINCGEIIQCDNTGDTGLFAATPDPVGLYCCLSMLGCDKTLCLLVWDFTSAFSQANLNDPMVVRPPKEIRVDYDDLRLCHKALPGLRPASAVFQDTVRRKFEETLDFEHCPVEACLWKQVGRCLKGFVHGDDGAAVGKRDNLLWLAAKLHELFECHTQPLVGYYEDSMETGILKMPIKVEERGWTIEGNTKHARELIKHYGLDGKDVKGVSSPGLSEHLEMEEVAEDLPDELYQGFRSAAGLAQYVAKCNVVLKYPVKEVLRKASCPTAATAMRLKRVARSLVSHGRVVIIYV